MAILAWTRKIRNHRLLQHVLRHNTLMTLYKGKWLTRLPVY